MESGRVTLRDVGTQDHLPSTNEEKEWRSVVTQVDQRSSGDLDGQEVRVRD